MDERQIGATAISDTSWLNVISREDEVFLPQGALAADTGGDITEAHGSTVVSTVNVQALATAPLPRGFRLHVAVGANYNKTSIADLETEARNLVPGTSSLDGAGQIVGSLESARDVTSFGWYAEPEISHKLFTVTLGLRIDGSSSFGSHVVLPAPKFGVSWLISDEPYFPFKRAFNVLRLRAAYGRAGVWPGPTEQLRLYQSFQPWADSSFVSATQVSSLGNSQVRPERSTEWEGGFDGDILANHVSFGITAYRKMRFDALMTVPVAPSVYGITSTESPLTIFKNIGVVRNEGFEFNITTQVVRSANISWSETLNLSENRNLVLELGRGVQPFNLGYAGRIAAGYPLFGFWARPILGYYDANGDGIIEQSEVRLGDTAVFMGTSEPKYLASLYTTVGLFHNTVTASAGLSYQHAFTQLNQAFAGGGGGEFFSPGLTDPSSPASEQAAAAVRRETAYGLLETVSVLRFNSLSIGVNLPERVARAFRTQALALQLQGTNLALWTKYRGKDPNVNVFAAGNASADPGVLPTPRSWMLSIRAAY